ncbi:MAG TPA: hypothetical protein VJK04_02555 [Candidatus Paceibacterota bacterium]
MAIEDLERKLYQEGNDEIRERNKPANFPVSPRDNEGRETGWREDQTEHAGRRKIEESEEQFSSGWSKYPIKKIIIWAIVLVSIATIVIVSYLLYQAFALSGLGLTSKYPDQVLLGTPFDFAVNYSNNSASILKNTKISVTLPTEFSFVGEAGSKRVAVKDVGDVGVGTIGQEIFRVIATSGGQSSKRITVGLDYNSSTFGPRFHKELWNDIFIGDSAASLDLTAPDKVLSGETFELHIPYKNISPGDFTDVQLTLDLPINFTIKTSSSKPDIGTTWRLGDLKAGSSDELVVKGSVTAPANSFFDVKATLTSSVNGSRYTVAEKSKSIAVSASPLSISITLNNGTDYITRAGDTLPYVISYTNNTDIGFSDVVIMAQLRGEMFDMRSLETGGGFNSVINTISWNASNDSALKVLNPGASGKVEFRINTLADYPIKRFNDKNFTLKVAAQIESPTVPSYLSAERTVGVDNLETKISGAVTLSTKILFRDAASGILNKGGLPLKVNMKTQFTVHWILKNFTTDVKDVEIHSALSPGVTATGVVKSNGETKPEYNDRTSEIVWKIPKIDAGRGVLGEPLEAIFQIEVQPSITSIGNFMPLIRETSLKATDIFTGEILSPPVYLEINSQLSDDPTVNSNDGMVTK